MANERTEFRGLLLHFPQAPLDDARENMTVFLRNAA
jgi:hypothetical protein